MRSIPILELIAPPGFRDNFPGLTNPQLTKDRVTPHFHSKVILITNAIRPWHTRKWENRELQEKKSVCSQAIHGKRMKLTSWVIPPPTMGL
jgi:hypothetical protein